VDVEANKRRNEQKNRLNASAFYRLDVIMKITNTLAIPEKHILIIGNRSYKNMGDELILL
jgi:energy-converting hydrogenase A subunit M